MARRRCQPAAAGGCCTGCSQVKELGRGCFGSVWLAKWRGVEVAIKEMLQSGADASPEEVRAGRAACTCLPLHPAAVPYQAAEPLARSCGPGLAARRCTARRRSWPACGTPAWWPSTASWCSRAAMPRCSSTCATAPCAVAWRASKSRCGSPGGASLLGQLAALVRAPLAASTRRTHLPATPLQGLQALPNLDPRRLRASIALQAARGMEYLHSQCMVHFDLKCDNLLCDLRDLLRPVVKIGDLGLSKRKQQTFISGNMRGTLPWWARRAAPGLCACVPLVGCCCHGQGRVVVRAVAVLAVDQLREGGPAGSAAWLVRRGAAAVCGHAASQGRLAPGS
jgi:hypothetical protein